MRLRGTHSLLLAIVLTSVALAACGGSAASVPETAAGPATAAPATAAPAPAQPGKDGVTDSAGGAPEGQNGGGEGSALIVDTALIVRTGSLDLEVSDVDATLLRARAAVIGLGGYVSDSQRSSTGDGAFAVVTYRIPSSRWDDALDALHGLATKVVNENTRSAEVTGQVVDLDARIANLRTTETALQAIMANATKISDILEVQNQLTNVRGQIEQLVAQRTSLADQAALGTLAVTFTPPVAVIAEATSSWDFGGEVNRAVAALLQLGQGLVTAGLWLAIVVLPIVLGFALAIGLGLFLARRLGLVRRPLPTANADR